MVYLSDDLAYIDVPMINRIVRYVRSDEYDDEWVDDDGEIVDDAELIYIIDMEKGVKCYNYNDKLMPKSKVLIPDKMNGYKVKRCKCSKVNKLVGATINRNIRGMF